MWISSALISTFKTLLKKFTPLLSVCSPSYAGIPKCLTELFRLYCSLFIACSLISTIWSLNDSSMKLCLYVFSNYIAFPLVFTISIIFISTSANFSRVFFNAATFPSINWYLVFISSYISFITALLSLNGTIIAILHASACNMATDKGLKR